VVVSGFDWDDDNVLHIERHQFTPDEVEEVFAGDYKVRRTRQKLYIALGETLDGRLAFVVFRRLSAGLIRVITARDMDDSERRLFRRKQVAEMKKKKLTSAKAPLPNFHSEEEAADYFETHSVADVWNQLPEAKPSKASKALEKSIRERHAAPKAPISIRLGPEQIAAAKRIAAAKSVGYQTQLRMWIAEGIRREAKRA
jgi:uncharacterized DUF497 family protein/predicted DNA binding CopG/RHH family protein